MARSRLRFSPKYLLPALFLFSCEQLVVPPDRGAPAISGLTVRANPFNAFAAVVRFQSAPGNAVIVQYESVPEGIRRTPELTLDSDSALIDVLALTPAVSYSMRAIVTSPAGTTVESDVIQFTTPSKPEQLPAFSVLAATSPSPGYVMLGVLSNDPASSKAAALIVDNAGTIVWQRTFGTQVIDFQPQPNGHFSVFSSLNNDVPHFYEVTRGGVVVGEFSAEPPNGSDPHELRILGEDYYLLGEEFRVMDLTTLGGASAASVRGITVEHRRKSVSVLHWSTFDHFQITDAANDISLTGTDVNPWHGNALDVDADGNILVSFRNSDVVTKIDGATGSILWRMGGRNNEFAFLNDPLNGFSHQHGIRRLANGNILLFDNGNLHTPPVSRAVEYSVDESAKTATLIWEYRGEPELFSGALGFAQRLPNGNTLICFGAANRIREVDPSGNIRWDLEMKEPNRFFYRAFRIASLYP